jgi:hypothetical protein
VLGWVDQEWSHQSAFVKTFICLNVGARFRQFVCVKCVSQSVCQGCLSVHDALFGQSMWVWLKSGVLRYVNWGDMMHFEQFMVVLFVSDLVLCTKCLCQFISVDPCV